MRLYLVKNNVPWDVAFCLSETELLADYIIMGQHEGNVWDWERMTWQKKGR